MQDRPESCGRRKRIIFLLAFVIATGLEGQRTYNNEQSQKYALRCILRRAEIEELGALKMNTSLRIGPSRRKFLRMGLAGTVVGLATSGLQLATPFSVGAERAQPRRGPVRVDGGQQTVYCKSLTAHEHDLDILKQHTVEKQEPFAAVLSCADSRVPVELVFDQTIGHIFVTRVAGNVITPEIIASLEYGAAVLGTKVILVMGHSNCGAVKAAIQGKAVPGQISALFPHIQPGHRSSGDLTLKRRPKPMPRSRRLC